MDASSHPFVVLAHDSRTFFNVINRAASKTRSTFTATHKKRHRDALYVFNSIFSTHPMRRVDHRRADKHTPHHPPSTGLRQFNNHSTRPATRRSPERPTAQLQKQPINKLMQRASVSFTSHKIIMSRDVSSCDARRRPSPLKKQNYPKSPSSAADSLTAQATRVSKGSMHNASQTL
jgi:hypothetical protein